MKTANESQVQLSTLIFSQSWEDPQSDRKACGPMKGKQVFAITSGGDNCLDFLLDNPRSIQAVDINPSQNYLLELKMTAIAHLPHAGFLAMMGIRPAADRWMLYASIRQGLSPAAQVFWDANPRLIRGGILQAGKFEKFIGYARRLLYVLQGQKRISGLFEPRSHTAQQQFFDEQWDNRRMHALFHLVFHRSIYPRGALKKDYFQFEENNVSYANRFYGRFRHALRDIPTTSNYFLAMYLLGRYCNEQEVPLYLKAQHYDTLRANLSRIQLHPLGAIEFLERQPDNSIDCFSLSNICELMSRAETERLFAQVARTSSQGAGVCFRNLAVPREVPAGPVRLDERLSEELLTTDRSFIYSKVQAYQVQK